MSFNVISVISINGKQLAVISIDNKIANVQNTYLGSISHLQNALAGLKICCDHRRWKALNTQKSINLPVNCSESGHLALGHPFVKIIN